MSPETDSRQNLLIGLFLVVVTAFIYWPVLSFGFIENYDDFYYILDNDALRNGLDTHSIAWAFTTNYLANWHPLTWISYLIDFELYDLAPRGYHLTNLLLHLVNGLLLFAVLKSYTGAVWRSAFVAALFLVHPLHIESVAWISERKDALSAFFWFLTMLAYGAYVHRKSWRNYLLVLVFFVCGLMAKPMVVTLPCVLLLADLWPLGRLNINMRSLKTTWQSARPLLVEKLPLFGAAAMSSVITVLAQRSEGAVQTFEQLSLDARVANAVAAYFGYAWKMVWPTGLSIFYPVADVAPAVWPTALGVFALCAVIILSAFSLNKRPYVFVGLLWYLGTLVPVIGIIQVGAQAMADRYTYIPLIGLFLVLTWGAYDLVGPWRQRRGPWMVVAGATLTALSVASMAHIPYWRDGETLFRHALDVTEDNYIAHFSLGFALEGREETEEAVRHYAEAIRIRPAFVDPHIKLADILRRRSQFDAAHDHLAMARVHAPTHPGIGEALSVLYNDEGYALAGKEDFEGAAALFERAIQENPENAQAYLNMGSALAIQGRENEAIAFFEKAGTLQPKNASPFYSLALALEATADLERAFSAISKAAQLDPDNPTVQRVYDRVRDALRGSPAPGHLPSEP